MKTYIIVEKGNCQYLVMRVDSKQPKPSKEHYQEYLVDFKNPAMLCSCKHWYFTHFLVNKKDKNGIMRKVWQPCNHFNFVVSQLKEKGGIIHPDIPGVVDKLFKEVMRDEDKDKWKRQCKMPVTEQTC